MPLPGGRRLDLGRPVVMGVVNVTPDSFSDGGRIADPVAHARALVAEGAAIIDVGGESTRPGAPPVPEDEERARVLPVIEALVRGGLGAPISVDTRKPGVARAALAAGAALVNDVSGLADPDMARVVADAGAAVIVMHMQGTPETMQVSPSYVDVVAEVADLLAERRARAVAAGVDPAAVLVDPGLGFGKTVDHNLALLRHLERLAEVGPLVVGLSRKSTLGHLLGGRPPEGRLFGGLGGAVWAALHGASVVRTHDVLPTVDALRVVSAIAAREGAHAA
ncbi:MAG: dihydropteroate synthase [Planctomycetes bacterium]|nr:dihydropteroate synthase [Planctomycetota bacterium]